MPAIVAAGVGAVGAIGGAVINSSAASSAAGKQAAATQQAFQLQEQQIKQNLTDTSPYFNAGINATQTAADLVGDYGNQISPYQNALAAATPGPMTQADLESTPGYQFTLAQGLKSTQNAAAARGLGVSGAALKGAAAYATGLSDQTYNTRFGQQQTLYSDASNNLSQANNVFQTLYGDNQNIASLGENAAVGSGNTGQAAANNGGNILTAGGNAQAASTIAGGNALSNGLTGIGNAVQNYNAQNQLANILGSNGGQYGSNPFSGAGMSGTSAPVFGSGTSSNPFETL